MKRQADAMIGHAGLREILGTNFFFTPAGSNLAAALCAIFFGLFALLSLQQACTQDRKCSFLVLDLTATFLAAYDCACRDMQHLHGGIGRIHALSTGTSG